MPQLDQSSWVSQLFWLAITFGALWLFVRSYVVPRLQTIFGDRERAIAGNLELAEAARQKSRTFEAEHAREIAEAHERARELVAVTQSEIGKKQADRSGKARSDIEARVGAAETRINAATAKALTELDIVASDAARDIVRRISGLEVKEEVVRAALAETKA